LAKNPEDRYASAAELAEDLERVRSGLPPGAEDPEETEKMIVPPPPLPRAETSERRERPSNRPLRRPSKPPATTEDAGAGSSLCWV
jgi:hypothetical protein